MQAGFYENFSRCFYFISASASRSRITLTEMNTISVTFNLFYTAPAIVVAISCVISVVVLTRRNRNVHQRKIQQSRNRATVTILLFALLYGVCNIPLVILQAVYTLSVIAKSPDIYFNFYKFDKHIFFRNATMTLLLAANSAANPILYYWRMPALREYIMSGMRRMLGLNREVRRTAVQHTETRRCNTEAENIKTKQLATQWGGANGEMANLTNEKGKFAIAIFRHFSPFFAIFRHW